jgi:tRNA threonylcarbamoyladenosine biosynthesis protein TsaB
MEVYSAIYDDKYNLIRKVQADLLEEQPFDNYLNEKKVIFLGDAVEKTKKIISHKNAVFSDIKYPSARELYRLAHSKFENNEFEDTAYFEPYYLKDFIVTKRK